MDPMRAAADEVPIPIFLENEQIQEINGELRVLCPNSGLEENYLFGQKWNVARER